MSGTESGKPHGDKERRMRELEEELRRLKAELRERPEGRRGSSDRIEASASAREAVRRKKKTTEAEKSSSTADETAAKKKRVSPPKLPPLPPPKSGQPATEATSGPPASKAKKKAPVGQEPGSTLKANEPKPAGKAVAKKRAVAQPPISHSKPQRAKGPIFDPPAADEEEHEDAGLRAGLRVPSWGVSLVVHLTVVLILALCTIVQIEREERFLVVSTAEEVHDDQMMEAELELPELEELKENDQQLEMVDPGRAAPVLPSEIVDLGGVGDLPINDTTFDQVGSLFGVDGVGMTDIGAGLEGAASFFGTKASGRRFVFVVDNSNSMTRGKLETALDELMKSIDGLSPKQYFYVIFFSDTAYPMFHPQPAQGFVVASESNKDRMRSWLYTVEMCLQTRGEEAMKAAVAMHPDAIYILGDGAFTDKTEQLLTAPHNRRIPINTFGMQVKEKGRAQLTAIAKANNGTFRNVDASPAAVQMAKMNPIRRNRSRGKIWGIKLPPGDKK